MLKAERKQPYNNKREEKIAVKMLKAERKQLYNNIKQKEMIREVSCILYVKLIISKENLERM